jgi:hypothetical protein
MTLPFDTFWTHCPKKVSKRHAQKAFASACQRASPETIIAGMQSYAASRAGQDQTFTKHPATWLNADGWLDQPTTNGTGAPVAKDPTAELFQKLESEARHV